jgi:hypothetical protein
MLDMKRVLVFSTTFFFFLPNIFHLNKCLLYCGVYGKAQRFLFQVTVTEHWCLLRYYSAPSGSKLSTFRKESKVAIFRQKCDSSS